MADVGYIRDMAQAKKGGEIGLNGEFYKGGQFVAGSETTIKGMQNGAKAAKQIKLRKREIAPYVWEVPPSEKHYPLWTNGHYMTWDIPGQTVKAFQPTCDYNDKMMGFEIGTTFARMQKDAEAWNRGERWGVSE